MVKRANSFDKALKDAERRLEKAILMQAAYREQLVALDTEIPRLQQIIASLSGKPHKPEARLIPEKGRTPDPVPPPNMTPEEQAKFYANVDLSGVKVILPERPAAPEPKSEDDTLPDDFAVGKR